MVFPRPIITPDALIKTRKKKRKRREREQVMKIREKDGKGIDYLSTDTENE